MNQLTDLSTIRALCQKYGIHPRKGFGQNFLVNPAVCPKLCEAAEVDENTDVLEIGPGIGTLTAELAHRARRVVSVELDKRLLPALEETVGHLHNLRIIQGDILKLDISALLQEVFGGPAMLCANLPYNITSPILMKLLEERPPLTRLTVMVQKEAAQRLVAETGTRESGAVTYAVHYYASPRHCFTVKPGSFFPPPKITSSVIQLDIHNNTPLPPGSLQEKQLFSLIRAGFAQRRKTLVNSLSSLPQADRTAVEAALLQLGLSAQSRPEQLRLEDFIALQAALWPSL